MQRLGRIVMMAVVGTGLVGAVAAREPEGRWVERDHLGRTTGTVEQRNNGDLVRRDALGRRTGTDERTDRGYVRRDALGRTTGRVSRER